MERSRWGAESRAARGRTGPGHQAEPRGRARRRLGHTGRGADAGWRRANRPEEVAPRAGQRKQPEQGHAGADAPLGGSGGAEGWPEAPGKLEGGGAMGIFQ